jgi:hypothetical protein
LFVALSAVMVRVGPVVPPVEGDVESLPQAARTLAMARAAAAVNAPELARRRGDEIEDIEDLSRDARRDTRAADRREIRAVPGD